MQQKQVFLGFLFDIRRWGSSDQENPNQLSFLDFIITGLCTKGHEASIKNTMC